MELEEWKMMVLRSHPAVTFAVDPNGDAKAVVGGGLEATLVGTYTPDGVVWFLGAKKCA